VEREPSSVESKTKPPTRTRSERERRARTSRKSQRNPRLSENIERERGGAREEVSHWNQYVLNLLYIPPSPFVRLAFPPFSYDHLPASRRRRSEVGETRRRAAAG